MLYTITRGSFSRALLPKAPLKLKLNLISHWLVIKHFFFSTINAFKVVCIIESIFLFIRRDFLFSSTTCASYNKIRRAITKCDVYEFRIID